jgi:hypothetical protein
MGLLRLISIVSESACLSVTVLQLLFGLYDVGNVVHVTRNLDRQQFDIKELNNLLTWFKELDSIMIKILDFVCLLAMVRFLDSEISEIRDLHIRSSVE